MSNEGYEARSDSVATGIVSFEATNVTGTESVAVTDVQASAPAGAVAAALAHQMFLPQNTPWTLMDDVSSEFLEDDKPIGEQIVPGARLTVTPKAHLG